MMIALFPYPLLLGVILLALGLYNKERWLIAAGDVFLATGCLLIAFQLFMVADHISWVEYGLFLYSWADYVSFIVICLVAGLLAGDGLVRALSKKSSSS